MYFIQSNYFATWKDSSLSHRELPSIGSIKRRLYYLSILHGLNFLPVDSGLLVKTGFVWPHVHLNRPYLLLPAQSTWQLSPLGLPSPVWPSSLGRSTFLIYNISLWEHSSVITSCSFWNFFFIVMGYLDLCFIFIYIYSTLWSNVIFYVHLFLWFILWLYLSAVLIFLCILRLLHFLIGVLRSPPSGHYHLLQVFMKLFYVLCSKQL